MLLCKLSTRKMVRSTFSSTLENWTVSKKLPSRSNFSK